MRGWLSASQKKEIGKNFRKEREALGLTQADVFNKAGFKGKGVVSNIERGKGYSADSLDRACRAMGLTIKHIANGTSPTVEAMTAIEQAPTKARAKVGVRVKTGKEWSIDVGGYRLTIDKEPEYILLEKI